MVLEKKYIFFIFVETKIKRLLDIYFWRVNHLKSLWDKKKGDAEF